ncbi:hypothetical protein Rhopal_002453-T1 [Rhodotorula paludigena]|uniref:Peroxin domain-containing protein n=1 Tax=Rhodotorula paludigena TaxID=86838 RepID=A0AAV5GKA2_9BASI|nr:hypothetical protein Rhopal_002453-T1 [Rhodotorula paludigena]
MPSFAIAPYLAPYAPTLRPLAYYLTWAAYYCSYAFSPGLVTLLQLVALVLTHGLPPLERWTERARARMRDSEWAEERWAWPGGRPPTEYPPWLVAALRACDVRWVFADAWKWVVEKLRALSASMGWKTTAGATAVTARPVSNPFSAAHSAVEVEDDDERGSVWSGKEWKKA